VSCLLQMRGSAQHCALIHLTQWSSHPFFYSDCDRPCADRATSGSSLSTPCSSGLSSQWGCSCRTCGRSPWLGPSSIRCAPPDWIACPLSIYDRFGSEADVPVCVGRSPFLTQSGHRGPDRGKARRRPAEACLRVFRRRRGQTHRRRQNYSTESDNGRRLGRKLRHGFQ
jgi:hypothetical protein